MLTSVPNLQDTLEQMIAWGTETSSLVVVEEHPDYPGELVFQVFDEQVWRFSLAWNEWLSPYFVLNELYNLQTFVHELEKNGWVVVFGPTTEKILRDYYRWKAPFQVEGYKLHGFQQFSLRQACEKGFFFFNWATGAGKSFVAAAGAKWLFDNKDLDVVIACTVPKSKIDLCRFFEGAGLDAVINDGSKDKRHKVYAERHQIYVMNYEKLWVDHEPLVELTKGRNTLFIFDESQKVVAESIADQNKARQAYTRLAQQCWFRTWPMSASVVNGNPQRFRDVFSLNPGTPNPLGMSGEFETRYADKVTTVRKRTKRGRYFDLRFPEWNMHRLTEIRHRVGQHTQVVRKTDPGVREYFKGIATIVVPITPSKAERELSAAIIDRAWKAFNRDESLNPYYHLLRYVCNTPAALLATDHAIAKEVIAECGYDVTELECTKLGVLNEKLESIRESGDQAIVFTHWTTMTLHLIREKILVPSVAHYGVGQSDRESQAAKDRFKTDPDCTCLLSSDAGKEGWSAQNARYVIQYDPLYSYDDTMQRASRIDRADSHLDGLTNFVFVTEDSVEERMWARNHASRKLNAAVQGSTEELSHGDDDRARRSEAEDAAWMIFGDRA